MYHEGQLYRGDGKRGSRYKYQVESHICIKFNEKETGIDPYMFGAWIGNGSTSKGCIHIGNKDIDIINNNAYSFHEHKGVITRIFYSSEFYKALKN